jgi:hypothetical protein
MRPTLERNIQVMLQPQRAFPNVLGFDLALFHDGPPCSWVTSLVDPVGVTLRRFLCPVAAPVVMGHAPFTRMEDRYEELGVLRLPSFLELHNSILANRLLRNRVSGAAIKDLANA